MKSYSKDEQNARPLDMREIAEILVAHGLSVIPCSPDKRAKIKWADFQERPPNKTEIQKHFENANHLAIIDGVVSGGLETLDFDNKPGGCYVFEEWSEIVHTDQPNLFEQFVINTTPSGGAHVRYRYEADQYEGSQDLAMTWKRDENGEIALDSKGRKTSVVCIETRGERGYALCPPSPGYEIVQGTLKDIPTITRDERDYLISVARSFHSAVEDKSPKQDQGDHKGDGLRPGDDFNQRGNRHDLLTRYGWSLITTRTQEGREVEYWRRPGTDSAYSATWNFVPDRFYVFSPNADHLEQDQSYDLFSLYAFLDHDGDFREAARSLRSQGYGDPLPEIPSAAPTTEEDSSSIPQPDQHARTKIHAKSAADLMTTDLPEPQWALPQLVPEGLTVCAGRPKIGKSFWGLNTCLSVALGGLFMGREVDQGEALYVALEDNERRIQKRLRMMLQDEPAPEDLYYTTELAAIDQGGYWALRNWLSNHPNARLIVIDTLARIMPRGKANSNLYAEEYRYIGAIQKLALEFGVAIVLMHHTRKASADYVFDEVSGTTGITGAADVVMVLAKAPQTGQDAMVLHVTGRDVEQQELAVKFDPQIGTWQLLGDAATHAVSVQRQAIIEVIRTAGEPLSPKEIAEALEGNRATIRKMLGKMLETGAIIKVSGKYVLPDQIEGSGGSGGSEGSEGSGGSLPSNGYFPQLISRSDPPDPPLTTEGDQPPNENKPFNDGGSGGIGDLSDPPDPPDPTILGEDYEERAAIMEFDGGLSRETAEVAASVPLDGSLWLEGVALPESGGA